MMISVLAMKFLNALLLNLLHKVASYIASLESEEHFFPTTTKLLKLLLMLHQNESAI
jgi:hypothetical protein